MNPVVCYEWLVANEPNSMEDLRQWCNLAESVLVYCKVPTYLKLNNLHAELLLNRAMAYGQKLDNHLKEFNDGIKEIERIQGDWKPK